MLSDSSHENELLDSLTEDFVARYRRGERPSLTEFTTRHPELADEIRELFPALAMMEEARIPADPVGDAAPASAEPPLLERVGEYRILREVGRGGMGIVYEAEQESLGRHVAVKVLPTHSLLEPRFLERFKLEARAAARLHHTNIVPVFGVGDDQGLNYYVMQFIQGRGLDEVLVELRRLRRVPVPSKGSIFHDAVGDRKTPGARADANRADVVSAGQIATGLLSGEFHNPASEGSLLDSTAAPSAEPVSPALRDQQDHWGQLPGSASWPISPEVRLPEHDPGSSGFDSARAYWSGVARIGVQVADALAYAHAQGVLHRDIKPSNLLLDTKGTVWVTDFGLAKETSSDGLVANVGLTRTGDVVGTLRYLPPERFRGSSDRESDIYSLGATLYELLTLRPPFDELDRSVLIRKLLHDEPPRPRSLDPTIPLDLETIVTKAMAKEPSDRYRSPADLADDLRCFLTDRPIRARRVTAWERAWRLCRRNRAVTSLSAVIGLLVGALVVAAVVAGWVRSERDQAVTNLERAVRAEETSRNHLERAKAAERDAMTRSHLTQAIVDRKRATAGHRVRSLREIDQALALKPTGDLRDKLRNELIASLAHTDVISSRTWDYWGYAAPLDVDLTYERYARITRDGVISVRRLADDEELQRLIPPPRKSTMRNVLFSPDGKYLSSFATDRHVLVWNLRQGELVAAAAGCSYGFDFTADSSAILTCQDNECVVYDLATAKEKTRWSTDFAPLCVVCAPQGDRVAIAAEKRLQVCSSVNGQRIRAWNAPHAVYDVAWHPDGKTVAILCVNEIHLWNLDEPKPYLKHTLSAQEGNNVEFSHDGSLLACSDWDTGLTIWDHPTGAPLCSTFQQLFLRFSRDDRLVGLYQDGSCVGVRQIMRSNVFRHFVGGDEKPVGALTHGRFSPDDRFLAVGTTQGFGLWEFSSGRQVAFSPIGRVLYLKFDGNSLLTSPRFKRWSMTVQESQPRKLVLGPPEHGTVETPEGFDISRDGHVLVAAQYDGAVIIHTDRPDHPVYLKPHEDCRYVATDGNGQWVATGSHWGSKVKVWDAIQGALVATLPAENVSRVDFSPDGRWLYTSGYGPGLWKTGTWEPGPPIAGRVVGFSPDSQVLVAEDSPESLVLVDVNTSRPLARLEHPSGYTSRSTVFSADGSSLVGVGTLRSSGFAWNLRQLRQELSARGLDWDLPPYPPLSHSTAARDPMQVEIFADLPDTRSQEEITQAKLEQFRVAYKAQPDNATACNQLAWALATCPESLRRADEAVELAEKAARIQPNDASIQNTLGVAYYRAGRFRDAVDCLAANLSRQEDIALAYDLYFLAMCHHKLGQADRARDYFTWANRWIESRTSDDSLSYNERQEIANLRDEAGELLSN